MLELHRCTDSNKNANYSEIKSYFSQHSKSNDNVHLFAFTLEID